MSRIARKNLNTPFVHVMVHGVNKEYIFNKQSDIELYINLFKENYINYAIDILSYSIMSNHAHAVFFSENINELSQFMHRVNLKFAQKYNANYERCGVLFRNRFQIEPIYSVRHLINCINYIHENPVKAKMVSKCDEYKYSSYNDYKMNKGLACNKLFRKIFGENFDSKKIIDRKSAEVFMDAEKLSYEDIKEYISNGIIEFVEMNNLNISDILSERDVLKKLIEFLKHECKIPYVNIMKFFMISNTVMNKLKM